jgi:dienelactone hydrolase
MPTSLVDFGGMKLPVELLAPAGAGRYPIVCALHGSGGASNSEALSLGELLAGQGFCVMVPRYFAATGTRWADAPTIWREFPTWMRAVSACLDFATELPSADPERIGLIGFSLGAYLALALGSQQPRVKAIVDFCGGLTEYFVRGLTQMPPVLILHGEADPVVPISEAHKLAHALQERGLFHEMKIYQRAGHDFHGFDRIDASQRASSFLNRHLDNRPPSASPACASQPDVGEIDLPRG